MANFLKSLFVKGIEIDTAGAITGDVLKYNGSKFGAASAGGGSAVGVLNDLTDVVITSVATDQLLVYNGTNWVNTTGPVGPAGATGATGPTGATGAQGATGPVAGSANQIVYKNGSNVASGESAFSYYDTTNTLYMSDASYTNSIQPNSVEILETAEGGYGSFLSPTQLSIGGNGLYFNVSNNRLGVGTSSPASALDVVGDVALTGSVIFEGATANTYETTLSVTDPTADRTITLPNASGTVALIAVSDTAPTSPVAGNLWYKSDTGAMYVYYDSFWVEIGSPSSGLDGGSA